MVEVPDRTRVTLTPIIQDLILPGSQIMSDGWAAYAQIDQIQHGVYEHDVVVHQRNFVDPNDLDVHTQNIENSWMRAKKKLRRQHGMSSELFSSYLAEFLWRNRVQDKNYMGSLLEAIIEIYPCNDCQIMTLLVTGWTLHQRNFTTKLTTKFVLHVLLNVTCNFLCFIRTIKVLNVSDKWHEPTEIILDAYFLENNFGR